MSSEDRQYMAARRALLRVACSVACFLLAWGLLSLDQEITIGTKLVMATLAGLAAFFFGPKCWDWVT